ncbi:MAG: thioesterase [Calditrichia bacterium]
MIEKLKSKKKTAVREYREEFKICSYDVDFANRAKPLAILNYMQEAAGCHAARLGVAVTDLMAKKLTWVLSRYHLKFFHFPGWGDWITVHTWPSAKQELFALRDFELRDQEENLVVRATSSWLLLNLETRRPAPLQTNLPHLIETGQRALPDDFQPLPTIEKPEIELPFRVRMADLDLNNHVNHTVYIQWALESVPQEMLRRGRVTELEVAYRAEAFYGDTVLSRCQMVSDGKAPEFHHQLVKENGRELCRLVTRWEL